MLVKSNDGKTTFDIRDDGSKPDWTGLLKDHPTITGAIKKWTEDWPIEYEGGCNRCGCRYPGLCMLYPLTADLYCGDCDSFNRVGFCEQNLREAAPEDIACCLLNKNGVHFFDEHTNEITQILNREKNYES